MYQITAHSIQSRMSVTRAGSRARRLPAIVLGDGSVIRLSPGRSVTIDDTTYNNNSAFLAQQASLISVSRVGDAPLPEVPAVQYDDIDTLDPEPVAPVPEPQEPVEEVVELAPEITSELDEDINAMLATSAPESAPVVEEPVEEVGRKRRGRRA